MKGLFKKTILLAVLISLLSPYAFAQGEVKTEESKLGAAEILERVKQTLEGFEDYQVEVEENSSVFGPTGKENVTGKTRLMVKKDKRYIDMTALQKGEKRRIVQVFDGRRSWFYDEKAKLVKKVELSKIPKELQERFKETLKKTMGGGDINFPDAEYSLEEKVIEGKKFYQLQSLKPFTIGGQVFDKMSLLIDSQSFLPYRQQIKQKMIVDVPEGKSLEIKIEIAQEFKNWEINTGIKDYEFALAVPDDVLVMDVTQQTKTMLETLLSKPQDLRPKTQDRGDKE